MIQWIGAICVVGACGACGFSMAASYTGLQRCLQQLQNGLELMQCQMEYQMTELPELCAVVHGAAFTAPEQAESLLAGFAAPADGRVHLGVLHGEIDPVRVGGNLRGRRGQRGRRGLRPL